MASSAAGVAMIAGSALFFIGAGVAVPRVFTEPDREERLRMLEERLLLWRLGQPLYALGALVAAVGVGLLAADTKSGSRAWLAVSCGLLVTGALAWSWSVYLRAVRPREFALGGLPGWPFGAYVWLTFAGLLLLGVGLLLGDYSELAGLVHPRGGWAVRCHVPPLRRHPTVRVLPVAVYRRCGGAVGAKEAEKSQRDL